jgi:hypothetical protein
MWRETRVATILVLLKVIKFKGGGWEERMGRGEEEGVRGRGGEKRGA